MNTDYTPSATPHLGLPLPSPAAPSQREDIARIATALTVVDSELAAVAAELDTSAGSFGARIQELEAELGTSAATLGSRIQELETELETATGTLGSRIQELEGAPDLPLVIAPAITAPVSGTVGVSRTLTVSLAPYYSLYGVAHAATQVQVATDAGFVNMVRDMTLGAVTSWTVSPALAESTLHHARARYRDANGTWSAWSPAVAFTTVETSIAMPAIGSPANNATNIARRPVFTSSAFGMLSGSDAHAASQWQVSLSATFASTVCDSGEDTVNKTSYTPTADLEMTTVYYARVRHKGALGEWSPWSATVTFTTLSFIQFFMHFPWGALGTRTAHESINKVIVDSSGNMYGIGTVRSVLSGSNPTPSGYIVKMRPDGVVLWERQYDGGGTDAGATEFTAGVIEPVMGSLIVLGQSATRGLVITRWLPDGTLYAHTVWNRDGINGVHDAAVDSAGNVYVATLYGNNSGSAIFKFNKNTANLWAQYMSNDNDGRIYGIACDSSDNVIVCGYRSGSTAFIAKLDLNGNFIRRLYISRGSSRIRFNRVAIDNSYGGSNYYINLVGQYYDGSNYRALFARFDKDFNVQTIMYSDNMDNTADLAVRANGSTWFASTKIKGAATAAVLMQGTANGIDRTLNDVDDWLYINSIAFNAQGDIIFGGQYLTDADWPNNYVSSMFMGTMSANGGNIGPIPSVPTLSWSDDNLSFNQLLSGHSFGLGTTNDLFSSMSMTVESPFATAKTVTRPKVLAPY